MQPWRSLGWGLLAFAFVAAAAENVAQAIAHDYGFMAASDVMRVLTPTLFSRLEISVGEFVHPAVWDYLILPLLALPAWLLIGVPGAVLAWRFRTREDVMEEGDDDYPHTTYEDIVAAAREADEWDTGIPSKYRDLDEYDPTSPPEDGDLVIEGEFEVAEVVPPARHLMFGDAGNDIGPRR